MASEQIPNDRFQQMLDEVAAEFSKGYEPVFSKGLAPAMMERGGPTLGKDEEITEPGVGGPAADYPRLVVTKGSARCYVCGRDTPGLLERSAFDRMPCCGECCWDLGYEAEQDGHLRFRDPQN